MFWSKLGQNQVKMKRFFKRQRIKYIKDKSANKMKSVSIHLTKRTTF